jgi:hypothetical protein
MAWRELGERKVLERRARELRSVKDQEVATRELVMSIRRGAVGLDRKGVEVLYRRGSRRHYGMQEEEVGVVWLWNDKLVEGFHRSASIVGA